MLKFESCHVDQLSWSGRVEASELSLAGSTFSSFIVWKLGDDQLIPVKA